MVLSVDQFCHRSIGHVDVNRWAWQDAFGMVSYSLVGHPISAEKYLDLDQPGIRIEGTASSPIGEGACLSCHLRKEVFGTQTNQGYVYLCRDCLRQARKQAKPKLRPAFEEAQNAKVQADALTHRIAGSYEGGKNR